MCGMKNGLGDFTAEVRRNNIFKPIIWNESPHQDGNDSGVRIVNLATTKTHFLRAECSRTETFVNTTLPVFTEKLTTRLTYK
jgi:hypothetical protein